MKSPEQVKALLPGAQPNLSTDEIKLAGE